MRTTQLKTTKLGSTGAIVGFRSPDQVDPLIEAANLELSHDDVTTIEGDR